MMVASAWSGLSLDERRDFVIWQVEWIIFKALGMSIPVDSRSIDAVVATRQARGGLWSGRLREAEKNALGALLETEEFPPKRDGLINAYAVANVCWLLALDTHADDDTYLVPSYLRIGRLRHDSPLAKFVEGEDDIE